MYKTVDSKHFFISLVSNTFLWMGAVKRGFCQCTFAMLLETTVYQSSLL